MKELFGRGVTLAALVLFAGCAAPGPAPSPIPSPDAAKTVPYFADNGLGNAVAVVQHPAGEHRDGVTYVAYQGPLEDPYVAAYDHEADAWIGPYKAGVSAMGKDPDRRKRIDNHGKPTLTIDEAGYINIFYGGHGGTPAIGPNPLGNHHYGENKHARSARPLDISAWRDVDTISPFGTYNQTVVMDDGDVYLFYRHGAHRSDWVYQRSEDGGETFEAPVSFLKHKRRDDLDAEDSWYAYAAKGVGDQIVVGFDYHLCWDSDAGLDARGHTTQRHDMHYMTFDTATGAWSTIAGEALDIPLIREDAEAMTKIVDTNDLWTFNGSAKVGPDGAPALSVFAGVDDGSKTGGAKAPAVFSWTQDGWRGALDNGLPDARGDFLVSGDDVRFLLGYTDKAGDGVVSWWNSDDGGASFEEGEVLLRVPQAGFAVSSFIKNAHPDARMIVAEKPRGTDARRMYLIGDKGPVGRRQRPDAP